MGLIVTTTFGAAKHGRASRIKDASTSAGQETRANKTVEKSVMAGAACDQQCNDTSLHVAPNSAINWTGYKSRTVSASAPADRSSGAALRTICHEPQSASDAIKAATNPSGQPRPVPNTPAAASKTARLPRASFRVQIHTERMLLSRCRYAVRSPRTVPLAMSAATPTTPITGASGTVPDATSRAVATTSQSPKTAIAPALASAAIARTRRVARSTNRLIAKFAPSAKKSSASALRATEPALNPAPVSKMNIPRLTANATQRTPR